MHKLACKGKKAMANEVSTAMQQQHHLQNNKLVASETLFIDDTKENTDAARELGVNIWNIK